MGGAVRASAPCCEMGGDSASQSIADTVDLFLRFAVQPGGAVEFWGSGKNGPCGDRSTPPLLFALTLF